MNCSLASLASLPTAQRESLIRSLTRNEAALLLRYLNNEQSLLDFIPTVTPQFWRPTHLTALALLLEQARSRPLRVVVSTPPRHGKTETILHYLAWQLRREPSAQLAYITYGQRLAEKKSRKARDLARRAGVPVADDARARADWRTGVADGGVWATSIGGSVTGEGFHVMVVDDAVKDRATAESAAERDHSYEWFNDTAYTRLEPDGSCIVNMARWHEDDLAGRLIRDGWQELRLPAIDDDGVALWPKRFPVERLLDIREQLGDYGWSSLYQGQPRSRGGRVFGDVCFYDSLPLEGYRVFIGIDLAYTAKTRADWSVAVVFLECRGVCYVVDVIRRQCIASDFARELQALRIRFPGARMASFVSTTEKGIIDLLRAPPSSLPIAGLPVGNADKFVRAQPLSAAWEARKVLLPRYAQWLDAFVSEFVEFTGAGDRLDDQVDAFASGYAIACPSAAPASIDDFVSFQKIAPRTRF